VEQFLYREARRLSDISNEWLELFTEDAGYWMGAPSNRHPKTSKAIAILNPARYAKTT
jgi:3-phenylpropionate/cinnamic acid dioxygenase small subunit